jgi:hypothetical protein
VAKRIQRKRVKGWTMPDGAVYVGRPGQFGNPFKVAAGDSPEMAVAAFRALLTDDCKWFRKHSGYSWTAALIMTMDKYSGQSRVERAKELLEKLRGKDLACWCSLDKPCHADVLLELANA